MSILDNCTPAQVEAITHGDGPMLVVAGAGSGKTRVITSRIAYLIQQGVPPWKILAITFTNKAAGEMKERVRTLVGEARVWVSTFHSMCARMLRQSPDAIDCGKDFTIYDAADSLSCIKACLKELDIDSEHWTPASIQAVISNAKNELQTVEQFESRAGNFFERTVAKVYRLYQARLQQNHSLDFDDLLFYVAKLMTEDTPFREHWSRRFDYVLIDEYQDTNHAQYLIARELAAETRNICATGDPDQSIYGWRGADIRNILEFEKEYSDAKVVKLEENFRSTANILKVAEQVIANNTERIDRALYTRGEAGAKVRLTGADDEEQEAEAIYARIQQMRSSGYRYGDIAVFYRTNFQSRVIERVLGLEGAPYVIVGTVEFYNRKEIKDILAYLRLLVNPRDDVAAFRAINTPPRGIGSQTLAALQDEARRYNFSLLEALERSNELPGLGARAIKALGTFRSLIGEIASFEGTAAEIVDHVIKKSGYIQWLRTSKDENREEREENLGELVTSAARYDERTPDGSLQGFLEEVALVSQIDEYRDGDDRITLMTVHAAKGLEFPVVFVSGMEEGLFPHHNSMESESGVQEERRLFYVAVTRAKKELFITHAGSRMRFGMITPALPSRFLREMPAEAIEKQTPYGEEIEEPAVSKTYAVRRREKAVAPEIARDYPETDTFRAGDVVRHPTFGRGEVVECSGAGSRTTVIVRFPGVGVKRLMLHYAKLEKV